MDPTKTKIWRGGLASFGQDPTPPKPAGPSQPLAATTPGWGLKPNHLPAAAPHDPQAPKSAEVRVSPDTLIMGKQDLLPRAPRTNRELSSTRVLPIEQLLPNKQGQAEPSPASSAPAVPAHQPAARESSAADDDTAHIPKRKLSRSLFASAVVAVLLLLASSLWSKPVKRAAVVAIHRLPAIAVAGIPRAEAHAAKLPVEHETLTAHETRDTHEIHSERVTRTGKPVKLERAAVDALIAGDYATAERDYRQLAIASANPNVFSEAARILAQRGARQR